MPGHFVIVCEKSYQEHCSSNVCYLQLWQIANHDNKASVHEGYIKFHNQFNHTFRIQIM